MSSVYLLLFVDSFRAMFVFSLRPETAWFAALDFGLYNTFLITLVSYAGSVAGAITTWAVGYGISRARKQLITLDEELFDRLSTNFAKYGVYAFLFQMLPFAKLLYLFAGIFVVPARRLIIFTLIGRAVFYLFYLFAAPHIPGF